MAEAGRLGRALRAGPILLDAAIGTRLIARGLDLARDDPSTWSIERPEEVAALHRLDVRAGADAILTNTFGADRITLGRLGRSGSVAEINRSAVALAREAAGDARLVLGSVGPRSAVDDDASREQVDALVGAGVDGLLFETHDAGSAASRVRLFRGRTPVPILLTVFAPPGAEVAPMGAADGLAAFGVNCVELAEARRLAVGLAACAGLPLIVRPSAGLPGRALASPADFAAAIPGLLDAGARLIGGCCGTTEAHVAAMGRALGRG